MTIKLIRAVLSGDVPGNTAFFMILYALSETFLA